MCVGRFSYLKMESTSPGGQGPLIWCQMFPFPETFWILILLEMKLFISPSNHLGFWEMPHQQKGPVSCFKRGIHPPQRSNATLTPPKILLLLFCCFAVETGLHRDWSLNAARNTETSWVIALFACHIHYITFAQANVHCLHFSNCVLKKWSKLYSKAFL